MSDAEFITAKLKDVRRRQFLSLLLNSTSIALLAFVFLCSLEFFAWHRLSLILCLMSAVALLSAALILSISRMPSWKATAKLADRALGLKQRLETSWECIPPREEIDALLLKDTSLRLSSMKPAAVFPIHFERSVRISLLACVLAVSGLGIVRILQDFNRAHGGKTGNRMQVIAGSAPQSKNPVKTTPPQNTEKTQSSIAYDTNSGSRRQSTKKEAIPETVNQSQLQPAQGTPETSLADKGAANNQPSGNVAATDPIMRANAGAASIRRAEKRSDQQSGAPVASETKANSASMLKSGQIGSLSGKRVDISGNDATFPAAYSGNYPALWSAAEQALSKEKYPPGLKKYIADYFKAIHP